MTRPLASRILTKLLSMNLSCLSAAVLGASVASMPHFAFAQAPELSYTDLAQERVVVAFDAVAADLKTLTPQVLPHEGKTLRKRIGTLRELVDIFAFAYPRENDKDLWRDLRKDLDVGYEVAGVFKDLFDAQGEEVSARVAADIAAGRTPQVTYPQKELKKRRDDLLAWAKTFLDAKNAAAARVYLAHPSDVLTFRDEKKQSRFYWAGAELEPKLSLSGIKNLRRLSQGLLEKAVDDERAVLKVKDLTHEDDEIQFHDFRKRIRSVVKISANFPEVFPKSASVKDDLVLFSELVDRYGAINDMILARTEAEAQGKHKKADALDETLNKDWDRLKEWQKDKKIDDVLADLIADLD